MEDFYKGNDGRNLDKIADNLYYSETENVYYVLNNNTPKVAREPVTNAPLIPNNDGTFKCDYMEGVFTFDSVQNEFKRIDKIYRGNDGRYLDKIRDDLYYSESEMDYYIVDSTNKLRKAVDPYCGAPLLPNDDGTFKSEYLDGNFSYNSKLNEWIPNFIMDLTQEEATLKLSEKGYYLEGNDTKRKFPVMLGKIVVPDLKIEGKITYEKLKEIEKKQYNMPQSELDELLKLKIQQDQQVSIDNIRKVTPMLQENDSEIRKIKLETQKGLAEIQKKYEEKIRQMDEELREYKKREFNLTQKDELKDMLADSIHSQVNNDKENTTSI